jgi:hypothetical protein
LALQTLGAQQSAAPLHVETHAAPLHFDGPHALLAGVGALQAPAPSHIAAKVCVELPFPSTQVCGAHSVPAGQRRQAPWPLQKPSVPHVDAAVFAQAAEGPTGTGLHVPMEPATAHDWHAPVHAELQQKPWAHVPETHSVPSTHVCPLALSPQMPFVPLQTLGAAQSLPLVAVVQLALHTAPPHWYGAHDVAGGVVQAPLPSQVEAAVAWFFATLHVGSLQTVPRAYFWQTPP